MLDWRNLLSSQIFFLIFITNEFSCLKDKKNPADYQGPRTAGTLRFIPSSQKNQIFALFFCFFISLFFETLNFWTPSAQFLFGTFILLDYLSYFDKSKIDYSSQCGCITFASHLSFFFSFLINLFFSLYCNFVSFIIRWNCIRMHEKCEQTGQR